MDFTVDWFSGNEPVWRALLAPALAGRPSIRALEVGTYEGRSALWMLENLLTGRGSKLVCLDDFSEVAPQTLRRAATKSRHDRNENPVRRACMDNLAADMAAKRVMVIEGRAEDTLRALPVSAEFDLVYIDADKSSRGVLEHAVLAWPLLKPRGFMVFDDYTNSREHDTSCPRPGIDAFLDNYAHELKVRHAGWQVIAQKRTKKLPRRACKSEFYHEDLRAI